MKITFKQVDEQHVNIMCGDNIIGQVFSPAQQGGNTVQLCGFEEAYDLWGCGVFSEKKVTTHKYDKEQLERLKEIAKNDSFFKDRTTYTKTHNIRKRDIQFLFKDYKNNTGDDFHASGNCWTCYNKNCTCDQVNKKPNMVVKGSNRLKESGRFKE